MVENAPPTWPPATLGVYVINLDRSPDRLAATTAEFAAAGIGFERVSAVDGRAFGPKPWPGFDEAGYRRRHGKQASAAEVGCYLSHLKAMRQFLDSDRRFALIMEDDCVVAGDLKTAVAGALDNADRWDVLTLFALHRGGPIATVELAGGFSIVGYLLKQTSAVAYLINRKAAAACLERLLPMTVPFDHAYTNPWLTGIRYRGLSPFPIDHRGVETTVVHPRKLSVWQRLPTAAYRLGTELRRSWHYLAVDPIWLESLRRRRR